MSISADMIAMLQEIFRGPKHESDYTMCFLGDVVVERPPEEALSIARLLMEAIRRGTRVNRVLLLGALQDIMRKFRNHPLFTEALREYENESGLLILTAEDERERRQAVSNINELGRRIPGSTIELLTADRLRGVSRLRR